MHIHMFRTVLGREAPSQSQTSHEYLKYPHTCFEQSWAQRAYHRHVCGGRHDHVCVHGPVATSNAEMAAGVQGLAV